MYKAIVATSTLVILIPSDGSPPIQVLGKELIQDSELLLMSQNIQEHGETELISSSTTLADILKAMGVVSRQENDGSLTAIVGEDEVQGLDKLVDHIEHSNENGLPESIPNLIGRLGKIDRKHSVEDLIHFISKSDMPVTKSGLILGYKLLTRNSYGVYDTYTKKIEQNVGSLVSTPVGNVDDSRNRECSNGLHVASLKYMSQYAGNTIVVVAVDPEDVFAVPYQDGNKMRVSKYRIVYELNTAQYNKAIKDDADTADVLGSTLSLLLDERFPSITETVQVLGSMGTNVVITPVAHVLAKSHEQHSTKKIPSVKKKENKKINIGNLSMSVNLIKYLDLFKKEKTINRYMDLLRLKRKQKKSWEALGVKEDDAVMLNKFHKINSDIIKGL